MRTALLAACILAFGVLRASAQAPTRDVPNISVLLTHEVPVQIEGATLVEKDTTWVLEFAVINMTDEPLVRLRVVTLVVGGARQDDDVWLPVPLDPRATRLVSVPLRVGVDASAEIRIGVVSVESEHRVWTDTASPDTPPALATATNQD
ncbi:MAG TPA: hypothetical protein VLV86_10450 [Vicinamibacterales bacterium]|nr:hypothetical protein [Vicinamibacterales bacterium]